MSNIQFITDALNVFADSTSSFGEAFEDAEAFSYFLSGFGWELDPDIDEAGFVKVQEGFSTEIALLEQMDGGDAQRAIAAPGLIASLMTSRTADASWPTPLNSSTFWSEFPQQVLDSFIWQMIQNSSSLVYALLRFGAVFQEVEEDEEVAAGSEPLRLSYLSRSIDWEQFVNFLADPEDAFKTAYNWGSSSDNFSAEALLKAIGAMFEMLPVASVVMDAPEGLYDKYFDRSLPTSPEKLEILTVMPYMLRDSNGDPIELLKVSMNALPIPAEGTNTGSPSGIVVFPIISGSAQTSLSLAEGVSLLLSGTFSSAPVSAEIRPGSVAIEVPGLSSTSLSASARVEAENEVSPWVIIGSSEGPRFEVSRAHVEIAVSGTIENPIFAINTGLDKAAVVIDFSSSDGFLQQIFGNTPQRIDAELTVGWSSQGGFRISGGASLDLTIPVHVTLFDTITIDYVKIKLGTDAEDLKTSFNAGVVASLNLGPLDVSVNNVGIKFGFKPTTDGSGNVGIFDVSLSVLPPTGAGFAIDASGLIGGGFLEFDDDNKRYAGILALKFGEIGIVAIGLIMTRMPDGSDGFSMLVNIGVTFDPPIQLSMGFTLSGVGGIIGVNRTMQIDVLREGVKKRTLDSILFPEPEWVIPNAAQVISDLRSVFPPEEGRFVIGPMVKIGYGSPNIIVADIGIFLELFDPIRIVLLGQLAMELPEPEDAIVVIHLDVVGVLDFEKKELSFQASLYDSSILRYELFGDAAFFLSWGAQPEFAMSLGGFHPKFTPPPPPIVFADLKRLGLNLSSGSDFQLSCEVYQALTPNSLQFGARVDLYAAAMGAVVTGFMSFDTLIYFSPFSFYIELNAWLNINYQGASLADIRVSLALSGPTPWNALGTAVIKVLLFDVDVNFNFTWGRDDPARLDPVDPWEEMVKAFARPESWGSQLPPTVSQAAVLRKIEDEPVEVADGQAPSPASIVVHPAGTLEFRQNVAPLETTLAKFGNAPVSNFDRFRIDKVTTEDGVELDDQSVDEYFARGQFEKLSSSQKLSIPSFEKMPGGVTTKSSNRIEVTGDSKNQILGYESILIQPDRTSKTPEDNNFKDKAVSLWSHSRFLAAGNAVRRSAKFSKGRARFAHQGIGSVGTNEEKYVVVNTELLQAIELDTRVDTPSGSMTRSQADQACEQQKSFHPDQVGQLMVVAEFEVEVAS